MRASVSAIGAEFVRQVRCAAIDEIDDQRAAGQAGTRLDHVVQTRRAAGGREMAERFGLPVQARGRRRVAFVRIGDARQPTVGQTHMAVRRAGRGQRLQVGGAERREGGPLAERGKQSINHGWGRATPQAK